MDIVNHNSETEANERSAMSAAPKKDTDVQATCQLSTYPQVDREERPRSQRIPKYSSLIKERYFYSYDYHRSSKEGPDAIIVLKEEKVRDDSLPLY